MKIKKVAVLGAGTMGSQIAAHLANNGIEVILLDLNKDIAKNGLKRVLEIIHLHLWIRNLKIL